jgi:starch phosphorylase
LNPRLDDPAGDGDLELLALEPLGLDADSILGDFTHYFRRTLGRRTIRTRSPFAYQALVHVVRDRLMDLEFLMGRLMNNALLNLDLEAETRSALSRIGLELETILDCERDTGLGNGGLGRLAACFLDSCATLKLPVTGYGIRYRYGMFHQRIENGFQKEEPDPWLRDGFPWEIERIELSQLVHFGGRTEAFTDNLGNRRYRWVDTHDVLAVPFDIPVPGYRNGVVNTLRLWSAEATDEFDLTEFNAGSYTDAVASKNEAENITMVLYPNAANEAGHQLRLRQQYFLASASLKDTIKDWLDSHDDLSEFADYHCFQLNDTHPAVAVAELMRLLMDEHRMGWDEAWDITSRTMAYTNHTLLPEALETWPVSLFRRLLPRLMDIIFEINARLIAQVTRRWPGDTDRVQRMSLIQEGREPVIRMAFLAIVGSFSVNGVAALHSRLLREGLFCDFADLWPEKFNNKTNGVTHRRWLAACNPALGSLISDTVGNDWIDDLDHLEALRQHAEEAALQTQWRAVKTANKQRLAELILERTDLVVDPAMMFDVQVKRIHEYKRQLLNLLHVVHRYDRIQRGDGDGLAPRAIIIGGKAAPGYEMAKSVIKAIHCVAEVINKDPAMNGRLQLIFIPDYNVSAMEVICPAADLSEQISTAGKEASGTGNMKFMMNGAITIGTLDGANVEIREAVGEDNFFLFGLTVEEVAERRSQYDPDAIIDGDPDLKRVMHLFETGHFNFFDAGVLDPVIQAIRDPSEPWMTAADFRSFVDAQERVDALWQDQTAWTRMSILNTAASGRFSTDRTMRDYNEDIWHLDAVDAAPL